MCGVFRNRGAVGTEGLLWLFLLSGSEHFVKIVLTLTQSGAHRAMT